MAMVFMCDCCGSVLDLDFYNSIQEQIKCWEKDQPFTAEDEVCDECLEDILDQMGYAPWHKPWYIALYHRIADFLNQVII